MQKKNTISLPVLRKDYYKPNVFRDDPWGSFYVNGHSVIKVTDSSPKELRRAVYTFATYFRREFNYDFIQYGMNNYGSDAYLFINRDDDLNGNQEAIGSACFRLRKTRHDDDILKPRWWLDWVWFHPYFRSKGNFSKFIPIIEKNHPECILEPPLSRTMKLCDMKYKICHAKHIERTKIIKFPPYERNK